MCDVGGGCRAHSGADHMSMRTLLCEAFDGLGTLKLAEMPAASARRRHQLCDKEATVRDSSGRDGELPHREPA
jgi:hypothetical protein